VIAGVAGLALHGREVALPINGLCIPAAFLPLPDLAKRVVGHYVSEGKWCAWRVLAGVALPGNPVGFVSGIGSGVVDLFWQPAQGIVQSPEAFVEGIGKGTTSLFKGVVGGAFSFVGQATGGLSKGLDTIGGESSVKLFDTDSGGEGPRGVGEGLVHGGAGVVQGVFDGVTGVFTKPVEGAMEDGVVGLAQGLGKGVFGLLAKPASGVVGLASDITSGVADDVGRLGSLQHEQLRRQRYIAHDGAVPAFDYNQALGQQRFRVAVQDAGPTEQATLREDVLEDYLECGEQKELLVTDRHLLYCSARSLQAPRGWIAPFAAIEGIDVPARGTQVVVHCSGQRHFIECGEGEAQAVGEQLRNMLKLERLEDEGGSRAGAGSIAEARASAARRAQAAAAATKNVVSV